MAVVDFFAISDADMQRSESAGAGRIYFMVCSIIVIIEVSPVIYLPDAVQMTSRACHQETHSLAYQSR